VFNNTAEWCGGGVYLYGSDATFSGNTVISNFSRGGGGLWLWYSEATLSGNTVTSNTAGFYGGGLMLLDSEAALDSNTVTSNTAVLGGGLRLFDSDATLSGNIVTFNTADYGGGLFLNGHSGTLINNVVANNRANIAGSGLFGESATSQLLHTTIACNSGGDGSGVYVAEWPSEPSTIALTNTILADHLVGISVTGGNTVTVNGILWHNVYINVSQSPTATVSLQNQHWGDTAFVNPDGGDYHIFEGSAAIDQGVDAGVSVDIDGESRPVGAGYDLGADEYPCDPVSGVQLSRTPLGALFTGNTVWFTADANGTMPFAYTWTLDGAPVGENRSVFEHTFTVSDTYTVGVTVTNSCSQDSDTMVVVVQDPAPQQPDLSQSNRSVNLATESGDVLTYTLVLHNRSDVTATAALTDAIPAQAIGCRLMTTRFSPISPPSRCAIRGTRLTIYSTSSSATTADLAQTIQAIGFLSIRQTPPTPIGFWRPTATCACHARCTSGSATAAEDNGRSRTTSSTIR